MGKTVLFTNLSPYGNYMYDEKPYVNGETLVCEDSIADAIINSYIGIDADEDQEVTQRYINSIKKQNEERQKILTLNGEFID